MDGQLHRWMELHSGPVGADGERVCTGRGRDCQGRGVRQWRQGPAPQVHRDQCHRAADYHVMTSHCHVVTADCHVVTAYRHVITGDWHVMTVFCHVMTVYCHVMASNAT